MESSQIELDKILSELSIMDKDASFETKGPLCLNMVIKQNKIEVVKYLYNNNIVEKESYDALSMCAVYERDDILIYLLEMHPDLTRAKVKLFSDEMGRLSTNVIKYSMEKFPFDKKNLQRFALMAVYHDKLDVIKYFIDIGVEITDEIINEALGGDNVEVFKLLLNYADKNKIDALLVSSFEYGSLPHIQALIEAGADPSYESYFSVKAALEIYEKSEFEYLIKAGSVDLSNDKVIMQIDTCYHLRTVCKYSSFVNYIELHKDIISFLYQNGFNFNNLTNGFVSFIEYLSWCDIPSQMEIFEECKDSIVAKCFNQDETMSYGKIFLHATPQFIYSLYAIIDSLPEKEDYQRLFLDVCATNDKVDIIKMIYNEFTISSDMSKYLINRAIDHRCMNTIKFYFSDFIVSDIFDESEIKTLLVKIINT